MANSQISFGETVESKKVAFGLTKQIFSLGKLESIHIKLFETWGKKKKNKLISFPRVS